MRHLYRIVRQLGYFLCLQQGYHSLHLRSTYAAPNQAASLRQRWILLVQYEEYLVTIRHLLPPNTGYWVTAVLGESTPPAKLSPVISSESKT